jgi:hypothetical protein
MRGAPVPRGCALRSKTSLRSLALQRLKADERARFTIERTIYFRGAPSTGDCSRGIAREPERSADGSLRSSVPSTSRAADSSTTGGAATRSASTRPLSTAGPTRCAGTRAPSNAHRRRSSARGAPSAVASFPSVRSSSRSGGASGSVRHRIRRLFRRIHGGPEPHVARSAPACPRTSGASSSSAAEPTCTRVGARRSAVAPLEDRRRSSLLRRRTADGTR